MSLFNSFNVPSPRWYRITKKIWSNAENLFIGIWLATGHLNDSPTLLIFKLCSSFIKDNLDTILTNGTEYAPAGATEALKLATGAETAKQAIAMVTPSAFAPDPKPETKETSNPNV